MQRLRLIFTAALLLGLGGVSLARAQAAAPITAPPIDYHVRVLPNGLKLYTVLDKTTPNVTVQVWYNVGAKNDPPGRSGFAHLFEHLMFKGTRDMPPEYMDRLTEDVGGFNNASTADDYTEYHEVIPANHLESLLWAEAERMGGLVVDEANFKSERQVVEEELRLRVLADPYGRLFNLDVPEASFTLHPYHRAPIGSIADLDSATLDDVRAFHATYYRPDNADLIVVGNFDPAQLNIWVDKYFAGLPTPTTLIPHVTAIEPPRTGSKTYDVYGPNVPLPAVVVTYAAPDAASPDAAALKVLDAILTTGKSSRLYQSLVYRQQLATQVLSEPDLRQQPGLFMAGAIMAGGKSLDHGLIALDAELQKLRDQPVSDAELASAKNQLIAGLLQGRETVDGRAFELADAIVVEGDAAKVNTDIAALAAVTPADVQRAARTYLDDGKRVVLRYRAESERPAGQPDVLVQDPPAIAATPLPTGVQVAALETLPEGQRQAPPAPGAPAASAPPHPVERTLANGLRVIVAKTSDLPIVNADLTIRDGAALDPRGLAGLSAVTAQMLPQGTTTRSAPQIAAQIESLGGALGANAGYDSSSVSLSSLAATLPDALPVLADVARNPVFAQDELDRLRQQDQDDLTVAMGEPDGLARLVIPHLVFGDGAYGHPAGGSRTSLAKIARSDVAAQYARLYRPDNAILVLTGDIEPDAGFALAEKTFGDWKGPGGPRPADNPSPVAPGRRIVVVDLPGTGQAAVVVTGRTIARSDPDFHAVEVANAVLGGGYSARLNEEIRIKRGLSYGSSSALSTHRATGLFEASAQTKNPSADEVAGLLMQQIDGLSLNPAPRDELEARKASLTGEYGRQAATAGGLGGLLAADAVEGVPIDEIGRYIPETNAVTAAAERLAAAKVVDRANADVVIVGDAKLFLDAVKKRYGAAVAVVPADKLDVDAAATAAAATAQPGRL
jgi:zinc protease